MRTLLLLVLLSTIARADAELEDFALRAAMLDPACYTMAGTSVGALDATVPPGHAWHVTNAFAVYYGNPISVAQDLYPLSRRTGFIRPLDARRALTLGPGTRIRNNTGINLAYILYCDPAALWASDARYTTDPRALYYERLQALRTIPTESLTLEATGGGAIDDDLHADLPAVRVMVTSASAYDVSWITAKCPGWISAVNLLDEINNSHAVRFADTLMHPLPACGARIAVQKGSNADTPGSTNPAIAYPIHGSGSLTFQRLPVGW